MSARFYIFLLLFPELFFSSLVLAQTLVWQQQAAGQNGSGSLRMKLELSNDHSRDNIPDTVHITGTAGQSLIACAVIANTSGLGLLTDTEDRLSQYRLVTEQATITSHHWVKCPALSRQFPGWLHYQYLLSDQPLLLSFGQKKTGRTKDRLKSEQNSLFYGIPGLFSDKKSSELPLSYGGDSLDDDFLDDLFRKRPPRLPFATTGSAVNILPALWLPVHQWLWGGAEVADEALLALVIRLPDSQLVRLRLHRDELPELINNMSSLSSVLQWLMPRLSGRNDFLNQLQDILARLAEEEPVNEALMHAVTQQFTDLLELPDVYFNLSFEWRQLFRHWAGQENGDVITAPTGKTKRKSAVQEGDSEDGAKELSPPASKKNKSTTDDHGETPMEMNGGDEPPPPQARDLNEWAAFDQVSRQHDACYAESEADVLKITGLLRLRNPNAYMVLISDPGHLFEDDLLSRLHIKPEGEEVLQGRLYGEEFGKESVILLINAHKMSPGQLAELNELYDQPPRVQAEPLGRHVKVVTLVSQGMKTLSHGEQDRKPASDFWSRLSNALNHFDLANTEAPSQPAAFTQFFDHYLQLPPCDHCEAGTDTIVLDFFLSDSWRQTLFGVPVFSQSGTLKYKHSALTRAQGKKIILRGAPWEDVNFRLRLMDILQRRKLLANGEHFSLADTQFFYSNTLPEEALSELVTHIQVSDELQEGMIFLNNENLDYWLNDIAIDDDGRIHAHDEFGALLSSGAGLRITSGLGFRQWCYLLARIKALGLNPVPVYLDDPAPQPEPIRSRVSASPMATRETITASGSAVTLIEGFEDFEIPAQLFGQDYFELNLTPDTQSSALFGRIDITSVKRRQFSTTELALLQALTDGRPVLMRGLASNPRLQKYLESLLETRPNLLVNGHRILLNQARLIAQVPDRSRLESKPWRSAPVVYSRTGQTTEASQPQWLNNLVAAIETMKINTHMGMDTEEPVGPEAADLAAQLPLLNKLLTAIEHLGVSARKHWPDKPPKLTAALLDKLYRQLQVEHSATPSDTLNHKHWRRAISQVILEDYRKDPEAYAWLTYHLNRLYPSGLEGNWIDESGIRHLISDNPITRAWLKQHFWRLSLMLGPDLTMGFYFPLQTTPMALDDELNYLSACLVSIVPEQTRILRLEQTDEMEIDLKNQPRLELDINSSSEPMEQQIGESPDCAAWNESRMQHLEAAVKAHPVVFLKGEPGSGKSYDAEKVANRLNPGQPPILFTAGPEIDEDALFEKQVMVPFTYDGITSAGLNHLGFSPDAVSWIMGFVQEGRFQLTADTLEYLQAILSDENFQRLKKHFGDRHTVWKKGPVQQWIDTRPENGQLVFLVIDEANLLQPGTLNALTNLFLAHGLGGKVAEPMESDQETGMTVNHGGREAGSLTRFHRLILTGNPESAGGRHLDNFIRHHALSLYYSPLPGNFLFQGIFHDRVTAIAHLTERHRLSLIKVAESLWSQYKRLLTSHEFTPRDIHDLADRIEFLLSFNQPELIQNASEEAISTLVWHACENSLGGEIPPESANRLKAVQRWFRHNFGWEETLLLGTVTTFETFYERLKQANTDFYFGESVRSLAYALWQQLMRVEQELATGNRFQGKHATLVEGPAGRGKDQLLLRMLTLMAADRQLKMGEPLITKTGNSNRELMRARLALAQKTGNSILVPEINILPSQYLEGELNDRLTGAAEPGFHLYATINPTYYSGRRPFSSALASRFTVYRIAEYSSEELENIVRLFMPGYPGQARQLALWHIRLRQHLKQEGQVLLPTSRELRSLAQLVGNRELAGLQQVFEAHYRFYTDHVPDFDVGQWLHESPPGMMMGKTLLNEEEYQALYRNLPDLPPLEILSGPADNYDASTGVLELQPGLSPYEITQHIYYLYFKDKWESKGLPIDPPDPRDTLLTALYRLWQREYAKRWFNDELIGQFFPHNVEQKHTLKIDLNRPYLLRTLSLLKAQEYTPDPLLYRDIKAVVLTPLEELEDLESEELEDLESPESQQGKTIIAQAEKKILQGSWLTLALSSHLKKSFIPASVIVSGKSRIVPKIFTDHEASQQRLSVFRPVISESSVYMLERRGLSGYDWVHFEHFDEQKVLGASETLGQVKMKIRPCTWTALPGLKCFAKARPVALALNSDTGESFPGYRSPCIEMVRDRGTDLYLFRWTPNEDACNIFFQSNSETVYRFWKRAEYSISVTFVLEQIDPQPEPKALHVVARPTQLPEQLKNKMESSQEVESFLFSLSIESDIKKQVKKIKNYVQRFGTGNEVPGSDIEQLINILTIKPGPSLYRSLAFWMLATYQGIPCRIVSGQTVEHWIECSMDGGVNWEIIEIRAHDPSGGVLIEQDQGLPKMNREELPSIYHLDDLRSRITPDQVVRWLKTAQPGTDFFNLLSKYIPGLIAQGISNEGPLTLEFLKERLTYYRNNNNDAYNYNLMSDLLKALKKRSKNAKGNNIDYHKEVLKFLVDQKWSNPALLSDGVSTLSDAPHNTLLSHPLLVEYYEKSLTTPLVRGRDIYIDMTKERESPVYMGVSQVVTDNSPSEMLPRLAQVLYGELPQDSYSETPPGLINIARLVRGQPAFRRSSFSPALQPVIMNRPLPRSCGKSIEVRLKQNLKTWTVNTPSITLTPGSERKSVLLMNFLSEHLNHSFMGWLYRHCGGAEGNLKLLFPNELWPRISYTYCVQSGVLKTGEATFITDTAKCPNSSLRPGYLVPSSLHEFLTLAMQSQLHKSQHLSEAWLRKSFAEPTLRYLQDDLIEQLLQDFLDSINFEKLFKETLESSAFSDYLKQRADYINDVHNTRRAVPDHSFKPVLDDLWDNPDSF